MDSTLWGSGLFGKIYLPHTSFIVSSIGTGIVNFIIALVPLLIIMLFSGVSIKPAVIMLPVILLFLSFFSLGVGLLLSAYSVFFPDIAQMYTIFLMALMYMSPVIIPEEILGEIMNGLLLKTNPLFYLIKLFRLALYYGEFPPISLLLIAAGISFTMFIVGWLVFTDKSDRFAYYV
jgi:ABC-2 type transport system permease protein